MNALFGGQSFAAASWATAAGAAGAGATAVAGEAIASVAPAASVAPMKAPTRTRRTAADDGAVADAGISFPPWIIGFRGEAAGERTSPRRAITDPCVLAGESVC